MIQEDEADDLLETIDQGLRQLRHGAPSLLQVDERMPRRVLDILIENFEIDDNVLVRTSHRLGLGEWLELARLHRPELKDANFAPRTVWGRNETEDVFELARHRDYILHHPFDSFVYGLVNLKTHCKLCLVVRKESDGIAATPTSAPATTTP